MRLAVVCACVVIGAGLGNCGSSSVSGATGSDGGSGSGGGSVDAGGGDGGSGGTDGGVGSGGGGSTDAGDSGGGGSGGGGSGGGGSGGGGSGGGGSDGGGSGGGGGTDGGTASSDCDGLMPAAPGAPSVFVWPNQDLNQGTCFIGDVDGTGHVAAGWDNSYQAHDTRYVFVDSSTNTSTGSYSGTRLYLIGQASGFMAGECAGGGTCFQDYVVLGPTGEQLVKTQTDPATTASTRWRWQANDPTGGMIHTRLRSDDAGLHVLLDAIDPAGTIRWTRQISANFAGDIFNSPNLDLGVDRKGNVLALWISSFDGSLLGQWFDHDGNPGKVFGMPSVVVGDLFERVGDGLFVFGFAKDAASHPSGWIGQFEPLATSMSSPPPWLEGRTESRMHMVHGGAGYAMLSNSGASSTCEQSITVISPSGQVCGTATFSVGGGSCTTRDMAVGYDGTVVQQLPRERENACKFNDHVCDCTYRYWPGYFR